MSSSFAVRHVRYLSTAVTAATVPKPVSISYTKNRLKRVHDPDEALKIYTAFITANHASTSPASVRYAQEFTARSFAKCGRFSDVVNFLESHKSEPHITDEAFLSSIIRSYGTCGMFEDALKTYEQMEELGTPRSSLSFNTLLSSCVQSKMFDHVIEYFDEFPAKFGFLRDKFSYGILIKSYCEMGAPEIALEKLSEMEENGFQVDSVVFTTIFHSLYENGRQDEAMKLWDVMVKKGIKPDVGSYNVRLMGIHEGEPEGVKSLMDEMGNAGIKPDVISYNSLLICYCKKGMMKEAKDVYAEMLKMKDCNPNSNTFKTLVYYLCKKGRFVQGFEFFKESVKQHKIPDFETLKYLVRGLVKMRKISEAKSMVRTINKKFPPDTLKVWKELTDELGLASVRSEKLNDAEIEEVSPKFNSVSDKLCKVVNPDENTKTTI